MAGASMTARWQRWTAGIFGLIALSVLGGYLITGRPLSLWHPRPLVRHSGEPFRTSSFFEDHKPAPVLSGLSDPAGLQVFERGSSSSLGPDRCRKDYELEIKGDSVTRDSAIAAYRDEVYSSLVAAGATVGGTTVYGEVSGFEYEYDSPTCRGLIRVTSHVNAKGSIDVDVFLYEHP